MVHTKAWSTLKFTEIQCMILLQGNTWDTLEYNEVRHHFESKRATERLNYNNAQWNLITNNEIQFVTVSLWKPSSHVENINHKFTMKYFVSVGKLVWQQLGGVPITGCRVAWVASSLPIPHHGHDEENINCGFDEDGWLTVVMVIGWIVSLCFPLVVPILIGMIMRMSKKLKRPQCIEEEVKVSASIEKGVKIKSNGLWSLRLGGR